MLLLIMASYCKMVLNARKLLIKFVYCFTHKRLHLKNYKDLLIKSCVNVSVYFQ